MSTECKHDAGYTVAVRRLPDGHISFELLCCAECGAPASQVTIDKIRSMNEE